MSVTPSECRQFVTIKVTNCHLFVTNFAAIDRLAIMAKRPIRKANISSWRGHIDGVELAANRPKNLPPNHKIRT